MWLVAAAVLAAAPPTWAAAKRPLSPAQLAEKREGTYVNGVPLAAYDPDRGLGLGVRVYVYANGGRDDPFFTVSPFRHRVYGQTFFTTGGAQSHGLKWEAPYLLDSPYRLRAALSYERDTAAGYFGAGEHAWALRRRGKTRFDQIDALRPRASLYVERDLAGGRLRPQLGLQISRVTVRAAKNSRLAVDAAAGRITGARGGWDNNLKAALAYDTRDYEPNPTAGVLNDFTTEAAPRFVRGNFAARGYYTPVGGARPFTLAGRVFVQNLWGRAPFFDLGVLAFSPGDDTGLGGLRSLRGYPESRFIGRTLTAASGEARFTFARAAAGKQRFAFMAAPFVDAGRVTDGLARFTLRGWRAGAGAGLRVAWNQATILVVDYGRGDEGGALYVNFGLTY